jgi:23S rRNA (uracil1939-C5)-methyltransferase
LNKYRFSIERLDPLGQGVSKLDDKVCFISKTLPGEEGEIHNLFKKKGVYFGHLEKLGHLTKKNGLRIDSSCPHYNECTACNYLHTSYEEEIKFKENTFKYWMQKLKVVDFNQIPHHIFPSKKRFNNRSRMQLHYDLNQCKLGLMKSHSQEIIPVPSCLLPESVVQEKISELYREDQWVEVVKKNNGAQIGHIEIINNNDIAELHINERYSHGGFQQVHAELNICLLNEINKFIQSNTDSQNCILFDFFGGLGNLSNELGTSHRYIVDSFRPDQFQTTSNTTFIQCNLFKEKELKKLNKQLPKHCDILILDPPRSGFKGLKKTVQQFRPQLLLYVSCHLATLVRDLQDIVQDYEIVQTELFDFFPGTFHFESFFILKLKDSL